MDRARAFLDRRSEPEVEQETDSLPELVEVRKALSQMYAALSDDPRRATEASTVLSDLTAEYERLLRCVGEEALARALNASAPAPPAREPQAPDGQLPEPSGEQLALENRPTPASDDEVRQWTERHRLGEGASSPRLSSMVVLHKLLGRVGSPPEEGPMTNIDAELDRLDDGTSELAWAELRQLPPEIQRGYLRLVVARLNAAGIVCESQPLERERIRRMLGAIRDYTREYRPGAVHGLARHHEPKRGSWVAEAHALWRAVGGDDWEELPKSERASAPPRRARPSVDDEDSEQELRVPEAEWPLWSAVRGRAVFMVGGSPREPARDRLQRTFKMRELVWSADDPRKVESAEARVAAGGYDLVLALLRFTSHPSCEKLAAACASRGIPYVPVEHGYGIAAIRRSLDKFLGAKVVAAPEERSGLRASS
jgi:hypothetical protein